MKKFPQAWWGENLSRPNKKSWTGWIGLKFPPGCKRRANFYGLEKKTRWAEKPELGRNPDQSLPPRD
jgi:hypothetical protein